MIRGWPLEHAVTARDAAARAEPEPRHCPCGTRLARDNDGWECSPCREKQYAARLEREGLSAAQMLRLKQRTEEAERRARLK